MASYSEKDKERIIKEVCGKVSKKGALRIILQEKGYPTYVTFYKWLDEKEERIKQYTRACDSREDLIFLECLEIADKQDSDISVDEKGKEYTNHNVINRSRLMIDTRKWMLGKMNPTKYGDRIQKDVVIDDKRKDIDGLFPDTDELTED